MIDRSSRGGPRVAVLFARADSFYKQIEGCDVWDQQRNALNWPGGAPVVAHPPCALWSRMRQLSKRPETERELAIWAITQVRRWGGVLEHPKSSRLWPTLNLPKPGAPPDEYGGWTLGIEQREFGHLAAKPTLLYIVGVKPSEIPLLPLELSYAERVVTTCGRTQRRRRALGLYQPLGCTPRMRELTPEKFARWLVDVAARAA